MAAEDFYAAAERRIELFTLILGLAGGLCGGALWGMRIGFGVTIGAVLSWINFRWMKQGVGTLAQLSKAQQSAEKTRVPARVYAKFVGRYALIVLGAYVILKYLKLPVVSLLAGLGAVGVAALLEVASQLFRSKEIPSTNSKEC